MGKSKSDYCVYIIMAAFFTAAIAAFAIPMLFPELETLWTTLMAAVIGMVFATLLLFIQDRSHKIKYRGQV